MSKLTKEMEDVLCSKDKHIVIQAYAGCVDKDTEYFNGDRWVKISEYKQGDKVLQFDSSWCATLVDPIRYIKVKENKVTHFKTTKGIDMMLSDNHRVIYVDPSKGLEFGKNTILELPAHDVISRHHSNKTGFTGKFITVFDYKVDDTLCLDDDVLRLHMAIICDGNIEKSGRVRINLKKARKKDRLEKLLEACKIEYIKSKDMNGYNSYNFHFESATKEFPMRWLYLNKKSKQVLFDEIQYWDGRYIGDIESSRLTQFFTTSTHNRDFIQMLASSIGIRSTITVDDRVGLPFKDSYVRKSVSYNVNFDNTTFIGVGHQRLEDNKTKAVKEYTTEDGYVYCFEVPSGMLVLRRGGRIFVTGNSGKSSTAVEYIKRNPTEKIIYLVFNKSMQVEFTDRLKGVPNNCQITTIHSLAYRWYLSKGFPKKSLRNINIVDVKNILKSRLEYDRLAKILFYFNMYLCSDLKEIGALPVLHEEDRVELKYVKKLWEFFITKSDYMSHNTYLKMYQLAKISLDCDTIIADELNDSNATMLSLLTNNMDKKIIGLGDSYQSILAFGHAVDGIKILREAYGFKEYTLTKSFRVSEKVAEISSKYLSYMRDENIKFNGLGTTTLGKVDPLRANRNNKLNILCRTKTGGLKEIVDILDKDPSKRIYYVGGLEGFGMQEIERLLAYHGNIYLGGERFHINELRQLLKKGVEDPEISRICSVYSFIEKNRDMLDMLKASEVKKKEHADIVVMTSHVSKGLTLGDTLLARDFPPIEDTRKIIEVSKDGHDYVYGLAKSEAHLLYVALTRSTGRLDMNGALKRNELIREDEKTQSATEIGVYTSYRLIEK